MTTPLVASLLNVPAKPAAKPQAAPKPEQSKQFDPNEGDPKQSQTPEKTAGTGAEATEVPKKDVAASESHPAGLSAFAAVQLPPTKVPQTSVEALGKVAPEGAPPPVDETVVTIITEDVPVPQKANPSDLNVTDQSAKDIKSVIPKGQIEAAADPVPVPAPSQSAPTDTANTKADEASVVVASKLPASPIQQTVFLDETKAVVPPIPVAARKVEGPTQESPKAASTGAHIPQDLGAKTQPVGMAQPDQKVSVSAHVPPIIPVDAKREHVDPPLRDVELRTPQAVPKVDTAPNTTAAATNTVKLQGPELPSVGPSIEPEILQVDTREQRLSEAERLLTAAPKDVATPRVVQQTQAIAQQISAAVARTPDGTIQIRLDPAELGRVTVTLPTVEGAGAAVVTAERPEVLDLLRRHESTLQKEMQAAGFANLEFSFSQEKNEQQNQRQSDETTFTHDHSASANSDLAFARGAASETVMLDRIDIRL